MSNMKILRLCDITEILGVSKSTIYKWMKEGSFPPGLLLGPKTRGWFAEDIENWLSERSGK